MDATGSRHRATAHARRTRPHQPIGLEPIAGERNALRVTRGAAAIVTLFVLALCSSGATAGTLDSTACEEGYKPCLPVREDLDCGQITAAKKPIRVTGDDPYGLDADRDGLGCVVSRKGGGKQSPWGLILRKPPRKEATSVQVGDMLTVYGWSPRSRKGEGFQLCVARLDGVKCQNSSRYVFNGSVQRFDTWKVARGERRGDGVFEMSLRVKGGIRAVDTVPVP